MIARTSRRVAFLALAAAVCFGGLAAAEEVTRDSYREAVEPICKKNAEVNKRIFDGVETMVRREELKRAAARFVKAEKALKRTVAEIRVVPRPPDDQERLDGWLDEVGIEATLFGRVAAKLRTGNVRAAQRMVARLGHQANVANARVIPFEFRHCRLEPSRFT